MVRKASPDEAGEIAAVLARAFYDDPVMTWTFPNHAKREREARRFFATRLKYLLVHEQVYTTDDLSGAAIWALPDRFHVGLRETVELALPLIGPRLPRLYRGLRRLEKRHPRE